MMRYLKLALIVASMAGLLYSGGFSVADVEASEEAAPEETVVEEANMSMDPYDDPTIDYGLLMCNDITLACGCHGYVEFGSVRRNYRCSSGFDRAQPCAGYSCPYGGQPWGARCTC